MFRDIRPVLFTVTAKESRYESPHLSRQGFSRKARIKRNLIIEGGEKKQRSIYPLAYPDLSYLRFSNGYI